METLIWPGHSTQTFKRLHEFFCNQSLCDVSLIAQDGTTFKAHQLLLAVNSSFFHWIFHGWRETNEQVTEFKTDIDSRVLGALLGLIYRGEVNTPSGWPWREKVLQAARTLQLTFLAEALRDAADDMTDEECQIQPSTRICDDTRGNANGQRAILAPIPGSPGSPGWKSPVKQQPLDSTNLSDNPVVFAAFNNPPISGYPGNSPSVRPDEHIQTRVSKEGHVPYESNSKHHQLLSFNAPQSIGCQTSAGSFASQISPVFQAYSSIPSSMTIGNHFHLPSFGSQSFSNFQCPQSVAIQTYCPSIITSTSVQGGTSQGISGGDQHFRIEPRRTEQHANSQTVPGTAQEQSLVDHNGVHSYADLKTGILIQPKPSSECASFMSPTSGADPMTSNVKSTDTTNSSMGRIRTTSNMSRGNVAQSIDNEKRDQTRLEKEAHSVTISLSNALKTEDKATSTRDTPAQNKRRGRVIINKPMPIVNIRRTRSVIQRESDPLTKTVTMVTSNRSTEKSNTIRESEQSSKDIDCTVGRKTGRCSKPGGDTKHKPIAKVTVINTRRKRLTKLIARGKQSRKTKERRKHPNLQMSALSQANLKRKAQMKLMKSICVKYHIVWQLTTGLQLKRGQNHPFRCGLCGKSFRLYSCWRLHSLTEHVLHLKLRRQEQASKLRVPRVHQQRSSGESLQCTECGCVYSLRKTLKFHLMQVHNMSITQVKTNPSLLIKCEAKDCHFASIDFGDVERHMKTEHPSVKYRCSHCRRARFFHLQAMLHKHVAKVHGDKPVFSCRQCGRQFAKYVHQQEHERDQHGVQHSVKLFRCRVVGCGYETVRRFFLEKHREQGHKEHKCPHCNATFKTDNNLKTHINTMHLNIRPFLCDICGMGFAKDGVLRMHVKTKHEQSNEYRCQHCPYGTNVHWYLANHIFHRHGQKADFDSREILACPHCNAKYLTNSYLQKHIRNVHDRTYKCTCDVCGKSYKSYSGMSTHKKVHQDVEQKCQYCEYRSKTGEHMNLHIRTQHTFKGLKPYQCPYCSYHSAMGGNVRKHVVHKHPGEEVRYNTNADQILHMQVAEAEMLETARQSSS